MSEGTHFTPDASTRLSRLRALGGNKAALLVAALGVAILSAGLLIQIFRAEPGVADEGPDGRGGNAPGTATVSGPRKGNVAQVGSQAVSYEMLADECIARHGQEVLDNIVNRMIIQLACQDRGIQVTEVEVQQEVQKIAQKFKLDASTWYQMLQAERNLSPIQYQRDIIWPMLALRKIAGENIVITDADRKRAYERDYGPRVEAKMIMLDNVRRAQEVWNKATQPDASTGETIDFGKLAREYSVEPTSRALGGDIPPIRRHVGSDEVIKQAFKLEEGEISGIIQAGPDRYVILLCEGHTTAVASYQEVRDIIEEHLLEEKRQEAVAKVFEQLKKEVRVDNYLTNTTSGGVRQTSGTAKPGFTNGGEVAPAGRAVPGTSKTSGARRPAPR